MSRKKEIVNPFSVTSYLGSEYFCDREFETVEISSALKNGRNITLISPRKMGKTGLIRHIFEQMSTENCYCLYVDLDGTRSISDMAEKLSEAVLDSTVSKTDRILRGIKNALSSLRPVFIPNTITGEAQWSISIQPEQGEITLKQIFECLESANKPCYVAFDEFQNITSYAEQRAESVLRSYIQHFNNIHFIFAGSQRHIMSEIFLSANRPFFQSTQTIQLKEIEEQAYFQFAAKHFYAIKANIAESDFHFIYESLYGHTWYIQTVLNRLYALKMDCNISNTRKIIKQILEENSYYYSSYNKMFTNNQIDLLRAIAREGAVKELNSKDFTQKYCLGADSSIRSAAKTLVDKEFLLYYNDVYSVYDRFYSIWLS